MKTKTYGLQNETRQYLRRLYSYGRELAGTDIADIDDFVKGLKQLGLWQYLVDAWLFSSFQNTGTGSNVVSFLNNKNNTTLVNSPTWNTEGILVTANNQYIGLNSAPITFGFPFSIMTVYRILSNTATTTSDSFRLFGYPNNEVNSGYYYLANTSGAGRDVNIGGYGGFMIGTNGGNYSTWKNRNEFHIIGQSFESLTPNGGAGQSILNNALFDAITSTGTTNSFSRTSNVYIPSSPARIFYGHGNATVNARTMNSIFLFRSGIKFVSMSLIRKLMIKTILKNQSVIIS